MKTSIHILLAGFSMVFCGCTAFPHSTYMQDQMWVEKPIYTADGPSKGLWRIQGSYNIVSHTFAPPDFLGFRQDSAWLFYTNRATVLRCGEMDISYGRSARFYSYGFDAFLSLGQYAQNIDNRVAEKLFCGGGGFKANVSGDLNRPHFTWRVLELQMSLAKGFGEYEYTRATLAEHIPQDLLSDGATLIPENIWMGSTSISSIFIWYNRHYRITYGFGFGQYDAFFEGFDPNYKIQYAYMAVQVGLRRVDCSVKGSMGVHGFSFQPGIAYRF